MVARKPVTSMILSMGWRGAQLGDLTCILEKVLKMKNLFPMFTNSLVSPLFSFVLVIGVGCFVILPVSHCFHILSPRAEKTYILTVFLLGCLAGICSVIGLFRRISKETKVSPLVYILSCSIFVILAGIVVVKFFENT